MRRHADRFERAASHFGREDATRIRDRDVMAMRRECESLYESVAREFVHVGNFGRAIDTSERPGTQVCCASNEHVGPSHRRLAGRA